MHPVDDVREARLKAPYAGWYPGVQVDLWLPAALVAHSVRQQMESRGPKWDPTPRLLSEEHFEFRGGGSGRSRLTRSRATDPAAR